MLRTWAIYDQARRLGRCRRGSVLILTGVGMLAMLGVVSLAIDMAAYRKMAAQIATASDMAALAGARDRPVDADDPTANAAWLATCQSNFLANLPPLLRRTFIPNPNPDAANAAPVNTVACRRSLAENGMTQKVTVDTTAAVPSFFARIFGVDSFNAEWISEAEAPRDMEVALVVDVSSSMDLCLCRNLSQCPQRARGRACRNQGHDTRLDAVRENMARFVDILFASQHGVNAENNLLRVAIVPFADAVNVGSMAEHGGNNDLRRLVDADYHGVLEAPVGRNHRNQWHSSRCLRARYRYYTHGDNPRTPGHHCGAIQQSGGDNIAFLVGCPEVQEARFLELYDINDLTGTSGVNPRRANALVFQPMQDNEKIVNISLLDEATLGLSGAADWDNLRTRIATEDNPWGIEPLEPNIIHGFLRGDEGKRLRHKACPEDRSSITPPQRTVTGLKNAIARLRVEPADSLRTAAKDPPRPGRPPPPEATTYTHSNITNGVAWGMRILSPNWQEIWPAPGQQDFPNETKEWRKGGDHDATTPPLGNNRQTRKVMIIISDGIQELHTSAHGSGEFPRGNSSAILTCDHRKNPEQGGAQSRDADISYIDSLDKKLFIDAPGFFNDIRCHPTAVRELNYRLYKELCPALRRRGVEIYAIGTYPPIVREINLGGGLRARWEISLRNTLYLCVSGESETERARHYRSISNLQDLEDAFRTIAEDLTVLRLTRSEPKT